MARAYKVDTASSTAIVATSVAKAHLKVDISDDDSLIANLVAAATQAAEDYTNRYFMQATITMKADTWDDIETLYKSPVDSITHIKYYDTNDSLQTLAASVYLADLYSMPARISLMPDESFPDLSSRKMAVEVKYVVGEGTTTDTISDIVKQAVLLMVGHWYEHRSSVISGKTAMEIPMTSQMLLDQYKIQVCR
mgnify:FL=1|tara:strand:- start:4857 stop:5438 length:582 start_codon:yes stop_codon:yes gene_type:complete